MYLVDFRRHWSYVASVFLYFSHLKSFLKWKWKCTRKLIPIFSLNAHLAVHHSQPWAKPTSTWVSLAGWLLSAPLRVAQKGLKLVPGQQAPGGRGQQAPLRPSQFLGRAPGSLMETLLEVQSVAQLWLLGAKGITAGAARTAQTSTRTMREPPSAA